VTTLTALVALVSLDNIAWHEEFKYAVICKVDGSLWVRDMHSSPPYEYPARDVDEVLAIFGDSTANNPYWQLL